MKPVFVKEWHGNTLSSIGGVDKNEVPGMKFYADFYKKFFETHSSWDSLEPDWVAH